MKYKTKIKKILLSLFGNCILGCGLAFGTNAQLGLDPCVSFSQSISNKTGYTIGTIITLVNIVLVIVVLLLERKNIGLTTLFVVFLNQYPVDLFCMLIHHSNSLIINILFTIISSLLVAIGCNLMIDADLGLGIYDAFIFSLAHKFNSEYVYIRYGVDALFLLLTFIFKGYIGIGTIVAYLLTGNLIKYTKPLIDKVLKNVI